MLFYVGRYFVENTNIIVHPLKCSQTIILLLLLLFCIVTDEAAALVVCTLKR